MLLSEFRELTKKLPPESRLKLPGFDSDQRRTEVAVQSVEIRKTVTHLGLAEMGVYEKRPEEVEIILGEE